MLERSKAKLKLTLTRHQVRPGDELSGTLEVTVSRPIDVTAVRVRVLGKEESYLRKGGRHSKSHDFVYLDKLFTVFGFTKASGRKGGASLNPGTYSYPFNLVLPHSLPPTYFAQADAARAVMRYHVEGVVDVPNGLDARVRRRFTVLASAPRVQLVAARETPASFDLVRVAAKKGMFSKGGGVVSVELQVVPSVVRFGSEPLDDLGNDTNGGGEYDIESDQDSEEDDLEQLSRRTRQYARPSREGDPASSTLAAPFHATSGDATISPPLPVPAQTPSDAAAGPTQITSTAAAAATPPAVSSAPQWVENTPGPTTSGTPAGAAFPATVARHPMRHRPSYDTQEGDAEGPIGPVHVDPTAGLVPAAHASSRAGSLRGGGDLEATMEVAEEPAPAPAALAPSLSELFENSGAAAQPAAQSHSHTDDAMTPGMAYGGARAASEELDIAYNLFGGVSASLRSNPERHNAQPAQFDDPDEDFDDDDEEEEQPKTVPRGRAVESFDSSLVEPHIPAALPPRPTRAAVAAGGGGGRGGGARAAAAPRRRTASAPVTGAASHAEAGAARRRRPVAVTPAEFYRQGRSRGEVCVPGAPLPPLSAPESDAEMNVRLTLLNGTKKKIKSVDVQIVELTEVMIGSRTRYGKEVLSSFSCRVPKGMSSSSPVEPVESLTVDGTLCMRRYLRTRGKSESSKLPVPTLCTSMCKTKTCLEVYLHGVKLQSSILFSNVLHLVNGVDETNVTVPGPLLFNTQHLLGEE